METIDDPRQRWEQWLSFPNGPLAYDVTMLVYRMSVYRQFMEICEDAPRDVIESGTAYVEWVRSIYADAQLSGIRRQAKGGSSVVSLRRLFTEMHDNTDDQEQRTRIADDRAELIRATKLAVARTTTAVAHLHDRNSPTYTDEARESEHITYEELHDCVDAIARLYSDYTELLFDARPFLESFPTMPPWDYAFRFPWIIDDK